MVAPVVQEVGLKYNADRQVTRVTRRDGREVGLQYDSRTGRLESVTTSRGTFVASYNPSNGRLDAITTPEQNTLRYGFAGPLLAHMAWEGTVSGTIDLGADLL
jgi:YD repeat-containing protein